MPCARFHSGPHTRYQEAREARGVTLQELHLRTRIPLTRLRAFENLDLPVQANASEIAMLCMVLHFPKAFFLKEPRRETHEGWICGDGVELCGFPGCGYISDWLCDWPIGGGKTCDMPLCDHHRCAQGTDEEPFDLCPQHAAMAAGMIKPPTPEQLVIPL